MPAPQKPLTLDAIRKLYAQPVPIRWREVLAGVLGFAACNFLAWMISVEGGVRMSEGAKMGAINGDGVGELV